MAFPSPTKTYHNKSYEAISPEQPALSQSGKNVVITGAGTGIGQGIALSFAKAKAANVALLGRRTEPLQETKKLMEETSPATKVHIYGADISKQDAIEDTFKAFAKAAGGPIHVLIANAGIDPGIGPTLADNNDNLRLGIEVNAIGTINSVRALLPYLPKEAQDGSEYRGRVIHVSTAAAQGTGAVQAAYTASKIAAVHYLQCIATDHPELQIVNYHPGIVDTPGGRAVLAQMGLDYSMVPTDEVSLPADFAVWAASNESSFLGSGRYLWAHWDVTELKQIFDRLKDGTEQDGVLLLGAPMGKKFTMGLVGWP